MVKGHVRERKTSAGKSYQLIVEDERDVTTGKRNRHYRTVKGTKKQAEAELRKFIAEVENGGITTTSSIKIKDWIPQWLSTYKVNIEPTTRRNYEDQFRTHIKDELGDISIDKLHPIKVQQWLNDLSQVHGLSETSVKNIYVCLSSAMKKAKQLKLITDNPCEYVDLPKRTKYNAQIYNSTQLQNILTMTEGTPLYTVVILGAGLGLRRGEMTALKWSHIDFNNNVVYIQENAVTIGGKKLLKKPKTKTSIRKIDISDSMARKLKKIHKAYNEAKIANGKAFVASDCVLFKKDGGMYNPDSITCRWNRFLKANNLPHIRVHDLRHSCATAMIQAGVPMKTVQEILGHSDYSTTANIYAHVTPQMRKEAADKIAAALAI